MGKDKDDEKKKKKSDKSRKDDDDDKKRKKKKKDKKEGKKEGKKDKDEKKEKKDKKEKKKAKEAKKLNKEGKKDKEGKPEEEEGAGQQFPKRFNSSPRVLTKKEATAVRESQAEQLRKSLALKKKVVECWDRITKDPTGKKPIRSSEQLLAVLVETNFMIELAAHAGKRRVWRISDGREVSAVHLAEETKKQLAENMFQYLDLDGNNTVEMNELLLVLDALSNPDRIERAKFHFLIMDTDGNGRLDTRELQRLLKLTFLGAQVALELEIAARSDELAVTEADRKALRGLFAGEGLLAGALNEMVKAADTNGDGTVTEDEFLAWLADAPAVAAFQHWVREHSDKASFSSPELESLVRDSFGNLLTFF